MSDTRALPSNPNLEFERKAAKALLAQLRSGDADALARATAQSVAKAASESEGYKLADAQLVIAREYGFSSWPRLVRYFGDMARQLASDQGARAGWKRPVDSADRLERSVPHLLHDHKAGHEPAVRTLAAYVPRFYGLPLSRVVHSVVTEDDARVAIARRHGFSNWQELMQASAKWATVEPRGPWHVDELTEAWQAISAGDRARLQRFAQSNPGLLERESPEGRVVQRLLKGTLTQHDRSAPSKSAAIVEWLVSQGADLESVVDQYLLGLNYMRADRVQWMIEIGANPNWVAPNGMSVLEHAILRWWSGEAVDVLAKHAKRRDAAWICAGVGDVTGLSRWFDARGKLRPEARNDRPDFAAAHPSMSIPMEVEPSDEELLRELLVVATMNERAPVIAYLVQHGADVNSRWWNVPLLVATVGNQWPQSTDALLRLGADPDLRGTMPNASAREMARDEWVSRPNAKIRRIVELLGFDPDELHAEHREKPASELQFSTRVPEVLALAGDDAHRRGDSLVTVEHLFFGLMRARNATREIVRHASYLDVRRFAEQYRDRLMPHDNRVDAPAIALDAAVELALAEAKRDALQRRRDSVSAERILYALVRSDELPIARLLAGFDADLENLRRELNR